MERWQARAERAGAWWRARSAGVDPYVLDVGLAVASAAVAVWTVWHDEPDWSWWAYALAVATALPVVWRRSAPFTVFCLSSAASIAVTVLAHTAMPQVPLAAVVSVYTVADRGRDWQRWLMLTGLVWGNVAGTRSLNGALFSVLTSVGAFVFGSLARELRRKVAAEADRAGELARRAAADAARAVAEERARIAREMHDILAHAVSLMVIQAEAGPLVVHKDPDRAARTFDTIADSGRDAMVQLRRVLGVLKEQGVGPELAPQPTLAELPAVVERVRESGLRVELDCAEAGPPEVQAAAYRIVQEALTNTVKHAGATRAEVSVAPAGRELLVRVADDGRGLGAVRARERAGDWSGEWSGGRGLVGIRERAAAVGGRAEAGPGPEGVGFVVSARLPLVS
ncbi:sensor histidine kinase [Kitasatospora sp. NPDC096147]|uniref:sensor histidine kinase n=1 Tax=Kitasatospora sp. NPDC096147 TaxID=3364093 RepID=UPI00382816EE